MHGLHSPSFPFKEWKVRQRIRMILATLPPPPYPHHTQGHRLWGKHGESDFDLVRQIAEEVLETARRRRRHEASARRRAPAAAA